MSVLGVQGWLHTAGGDELIGFVRQGRPTIVKILDPHAASYERLSALRSASSSTIIVWRFVAYFEDRKGAVLSADPQTAERLAQEHYAELSAFLLPRRDLFDIVETLNEPSYAPSLLAYERAFARAAAKDGLRVGSFAFSTGTPPEDVFPILQSYAPEPNQFFAPHEYCWNNSPQYSYHIGRYRRWIPPGARFYIGETGQEPGGWRVWGYDQFKQLMAEIDGYYEQDARCMGAAIFCWNSPGGGAWTDFAIFGTGLDAWLLDRITRVSPAQNRRALLAAQVSAPQFFCGDIVTPKAYLNLRSSPQFAQNIIRVMSPGERLVVREMLGTSWARVVALNDMKEGWCAASYLLLLLRPCA